jgi:hypothetical protein
MKVFVSPTRWPRLSNSNNNWAVTRVTIACDFITMGNALRFELSKTVAPDAAGLSQREFGAAPQYIRVLEFQKNGKTTMNVYGTVVTDEMATASGKVARLVVNGTGTGTGPTSTPGRAGAVSLCDGVRSEGSANDLF